MKKLSDLAAQYEKAEALLLRLEAQPAELEAEREKLVSAADLDCEPSAELTSVATRLSVLPTKIDQATKRLEALRVGLEEENKAVATQLGRIAEERQAKLAEALIKAIKPLISKIDSVEKGGFLGNLISHCDAYVELSGFRFAGNGAYMVPAITKTRELLAMRSFAGL